MFQIKQQFIRLNRSNEKLNAIGVVLHETANPNDSDEMEQRYFNSGNRKASAHAFIDADSITQTVPWSEVAWHAGRTANHKFIGVELCHATTRARFDVIYQQGVELFAYLFVNVLHINTVTKDNLMSHAEVSNKWKETDHQDPISYFRKFGKTVDGFRGDVQKMIDDNLFKNAVNKLQSKSIISSPDYWLLNCKAGKTVEGKYVNTVILKFVAMYKIVNTFAEAVGALKGMGVISSPDYWLKYVDGFMADGGYVRKLLVSMAGKY